MSIQYFVIARQFCPVCDGRGYMVNPTWRRYFAVGGNVKEFFSSEGYEIVPPEEEECFACGGVGYVETKVSLAEVLATLQNEVA